MRLITQSLLALNLIVFAMGSCTTEAFAGAARRGTPRHVSPRICKQGLQIGPGGNFGVFVFCDDAAGTTIGVIALTPNRGKNAAVMSKAWPLENRFWQDAEWARDVTYFKWSRDGTNLTVRTNYIYGTNKLYTLDLVNKKVLSAVEQAVTQ